MPPPQPVSTVSVTVTDSPAGVDRPRRCTTFSSTVALASVGAGEKEKPVTSASTSVKPAGAVRSDEPSCCWSVRFVYVAVIVAVEPPGTVEGANTSP